MRKPTLLLGTLISAVLFADLATAESTMRCGRSLVSRGDSQGEVLTQCGEPVFASQRSIYRSGIPNRQFRSLSIGNNYFTDITNWELIQHNRSTVEVPVDIWTYNFGPRYFMREVTFIDGRISTIKTLGYGN